MLYHSNILVVVRPYTLHFLEEGRRMAYYFFKLIGQVRNTAIL